MAYSYIDGRVEEVNWPESLRPVLRPEFTPRPIDSPPNRAARRRRARALTRGRRGARRVEAPGRPSVFRFERLRYSEWAAHMLRWPDGREVFLYLPRGVDVTDTHLDAMSEYMNDSSH